MRNDAYKQIKNDVVKESKTNKVPALGHFELTARCNFDCKMCYVHNKKNSEYISRELTTEQWKRIFDEACDCGLAYAYLSGGECLLRKDFKELYLHLWNKMIFVSVLSNGVLIDEDYIEFFKTYPPDMIQISLYGSSEDGYLRVTGHKGFEKTIAAITALEAAGIDVRVSVTPTAYIKDDFINILKLCEEKGFYTEVGSYTLLPNRDDSGKSDYYLTEDEIVALAVQRTQLHKPVVCVSNTPEPCGLMTETIPNGLTCSGGNCTATILWDGRMFPCYNAMDGSGASLLEMSYAEAWEKTKSLAASFVHCIECVGCAYSKVCEHCHPLRSKGFTSGHCNPEICSLTRKLVAAGVLELDNE